MKKLENVLFFPSFLLISCLIFISACSSVFYYPDNYLYMKPERAGVTAEDIWFSSNDGTDLNAWILSMPNVAADNGVVVQFHGNAQNLSSHFVNLAWLTQYGYRLFTFDYRGYGRSGGKTEPYGIIDDGLAALDYAWKNYFLPLKEKNTKARFIVIGQSLGGAVAAQAVSRWAERKKINLLVLESTFSSYRKLAFNRLASNWLTWLFSPIGCTIVHESTASRYVLHEMDYLPILIMHGTDDHIIPYKFGKVVFDLIPPGKKEFWAIEGADHLATFLHSPEYKTRLVNYIQQL